MHAGHLGERLEHRGACVEHLDGHVACQGEPAGHRDEHVEHYAEYVEHRDVRVGREEGHFEHLGLLPPKCAAAEGPRHDIATLWMALLWTASSTAAPLAWARTRR